MATAQNRIPVGFGGHASGPEGVGVRPAVEGDLAAIATIESESFSNPWQPDAFRSLLKQERAQLLVAEDPVAGVVGYAVLWWVLDQGELANLAVRRDHRRTGIGSILLDQAIAHAESQGVGSFFLEVRMSNEQAYRLYSNRGFSQISIREDYYRNPREDARILVKQLSPNRGVDGGMDSVG